MLKDTKSYKEYFWIAAITLLARVFVFPIFSLSDTTEGRYAGIAKNMLDYGDWITPRLWYHGELIPFLGKPPLFFWSSAVCMKIFGQNEFAARLPGFLSFVIILVLMYIVLRRYENSTIAWRAVFFSMSSIVLFVASGLVIVDIMLSLGISGAIFSYYAFTNETDKRLRKRWSLMIFACLAIGFMVKGPVAILMFGLPIFVWTAFYRKWNDFKEHAWVSGIIIFVIVVAPWFVLAEIKNPGFLKYFLVHENFLRFVTHHYGDKYGSGHEHIRGAAIYMMLFAASPWSFYAIFRLSYKRQALSVSKIFKNEKLNFFLFAVVLDTLFWSMARQLLITYLFPLVPVFAAWLAILIEKQGQGKGKQCHVFNQHAFVICIITIAGLLIAAPIISENKSTKAVIEICNDSFTSKKIYFIHKVPYSAYFYAKDKIIPHPNESIEDSFNAIEKSDNTVCVINRKYYNKLPEAIRKQKWCIESKGRYIVLDSF